MKLVEYFGPAAIAAKVDTLGGPILRRGSLADRITQPDSHLGLEKEVSAMAASVTKTLPSLGFFTVTEDATVGFIGGLLVINAAGRPLEFHCTAPLKPNRAQEILYGPTLRPFLYGEQIGVTLASKAKSDTLFLCTDQEFAMCMREGIATPLLLVSSIAAPESPSTADASKQQWLPLETPTPLPSDSSGALKRFVLGHQQVAVLQSFAGDQEEIERSWSLCAGQIDLNEPFQRVRDALAEAQRGVGK